MHSVPASRPTSGSPATKSLLLPWCEVQFILADQLKLVRSVVTTSTAVVCDIYDPRNTGYAAEALYSPLRSKLKDGRTHLAYKAEHAVDLETGAVVAVTVASGAAGDAETILETLLQAGEQIAEVACVTNNEEVGERVEADGPQEVVTDKGYHSNDTLQALREEVRTYISEPDRGRRRWHGKPEAQQAVYGNRRRIGGERGKHP